MDQRASKSGDRSQRLELVTTLLCAVFVLVVGIASVDPVDAAPTDLTGTWQHVGSKGQTTLRVEDNGSEVHVVVEGLNFLTFEEYRFIPDGVDRQIDKRLVTCTRDDGGLTTVLRRMGTTSNAEGTTEVVRSSKTIVWTRTDDSTLKLTVTGSRGYASMLARDYVFSMRNTRSETVYNTSEEEAEQ
jgi:hypothetical protein